MQDYRDTESYTPPTPTRAGLGVVFAIIFLLLVIMGLIAGWGEFLKAAPILVQMLTYTVIIGLPLVVLYLCSKDIYTWLHQAKRISIETQLLAVEKLKAEEQVEDMRANRERENLLAAASADRIRAEAEKLLSTIDWDDQGNAARYDPLTRQIIQLQGQMRLYPALSSLHYHNSMTGAKAEEMKTIVTPVFPDPCNFADILRDGWRPSAQGIYLLKTIQEPVTVGMHRVCHVGLGGPTGGGKTNTTRLLSGQLLACDAEMYLANINYAPVKLNDKHLEDWRPIAARLKEPPARSIEQIKDLMTRFLQLFERRRENEQASPRRGKDIYLILCEWPAIVARWKDAPAILNMLLRESRQYGIHIISEFQDALVSTIGGSSGSRENYRTGYYFGGDAKTASVLLDLKPGQKVEETGLGELGAVYLRAHGQAARPGRVPWFPNQALYMLLGAPPDPVTDEPIYDMSQIPEAYQPYIEAGRSPGADGRPDGEPFDELRGARSADAQGMLLMGHDRRNTGALQNLVDPPVERWSVAPNGRQGYPLMDEVQVTQFIALYPVLGNVDRCLDRIEGCNHRHREHARVIIEERKLRKA